MNGQTTGEYTVTLTPAGEAAIAAAPDDRPGRSHGRDQRAAMRGVFTPTKPAAATKVGELPDKVDAYLATCNRKQRRAFVADAKRSHRKAGKELRQAQGKLSRLVGPGAVRP